MDIADLLAKNTQMIDVHLAKNLETPESLLETLYSSMRYSALSGGKRVRPFLTMEFCRLFGGEPAAAVDFACAVEYVHASSLVHDDMPCMDNDALRRGKPTNHVIFGEDIALLCGDALITRGYEMAACNKKVPAEAALAATALLLREAGARGMMGGQEIDLTSEGKSIPFETLMAMHEKKTGALIKAACLLGAIAAGVTDSGDARYKAAEKYAHGIGIAFQIVDDILDAEGDAALMGKATHADAALEKTNFLSFMSVQDARACAEALTEEAIDAITPYDGSETLTELAKFLLYRIK